MSGCLSIPLRDRQYRFKLVRSARSCTKLLLHATDIDASAGSAHMRAAAQGRTAAMPERHYYLILTRDPGIAFDVGPRVTCHVLLHV